MAVRQVCVDIMWDLRAGGKARFAPGAHEYPKRKNLKGMTGM